MPTSVKEITFGNSWVPQYLTFPVDHDFKRALAKNQQNIRSLIGSNKVMGMDMFISILLQLPFNLAQYSFTLLSQKITMTLSSAPGPKECLYYGDYKIDGLIAFIPSIGDMVFGMAMVSFGDVMQFSLMTDQSCVSNPDLFMQILNRKL
jgi:hypothetical protein